MSCQRSPCRYSYQGAPIGNTVIDLTKVLNPSRLSISDDFGGDLWVTYCRPSILVPF